MFKYTEELAEKLVSTVSNVELKEATKTYKMVVSKEVADRDWETVKIAGIDLKSYKKNPVVLLDHSYKVENIVWKTTKIKVEDNSLVADFVFASTPNGILAEKLYNEGLLKTSSIWFIVKQRNSQDFAIIEKSELLEWSLVAVPCNPEALSLDEKKMALVSKWIEAWLIKQVEEEVKSDEDEEPTDELDIKREVKELREEIKELKGLLIDFANDKAKETELKKEQENIVSEKKQIQLATRILSDVLWRVKMTDKK